MIVINQNNFGGQNSISVNKYVYILKAEPEKCGQDDECPQTEDRNPSPFSSLISNPQFIEQVMRMLHELVDRQTSPKAIVMPIRAAMDAGVIGRPSWRQFCLEFGEAKLKSKSSLTDYTQESYQYGGEDFLQMKAAFCSLGN